MVIVQVYVRVKKNSVEDFINATIENAKNSLEEPGVVRFDCMQQNDDPTAFLLTEIYKDLEGPKAHKATAHYLSWRGLVAEMMANPRESVKYHEIYPQNQTMWRSKDV